MERKLIYVDNASTTPVSPDVFEAMRPFFQAYYGNPSNIYSLGRQAKKAIEEARASIAVLLGAKANEVYFTGSGTESDNWAIKSAAALMRKKGKRHIVSTSIEHHAVLHCLKELERDGYAVTYLDVHESGIVFPQELEAALREDTGLVSIMYANNEIGTIQPIPEIGRLCKAHGVLFHTDAVQAVGQLPVHMERDGLDLLTISGHKLHGPKGVGVLCVRTGIDLPAFIHGGAQERGKRGGTENPALIVGLAKALERSAGSGHEEMKERNARVQRMRNRLIDALLQIPHSRLNGDMERRLPGNANFSFAGIEGESLLLMLDMQGICASSGSACAAGSPDPSHVLLALGLSPEAARSSLRITLNEDNTDEDIDRLIEALPPIVERLRKMSPLWQSLHELNE